MMLHPLAYLFMASTPVQEGYAHVAVAEIEAFRLHMHERSKAISEEAHTALLKQWPGLLNCLLLKATRDACAHLRRRTVTSNN